MANDTMAKIPPQNVEAEQSVLGALLLDKDALIKVADFLKPDDFYRDDHKEIYQAILKLYEKRKPIDVLTLTDILEKEKKLKSVGGASYLATLVNSVPTAANVVTYAQIVQQKATLRRLISAATNIVELGYNETTELETLLDKAESTLFNVSQQYVRQYFTPIKDVLAESFERIDKLHREKGVLRGVPTGFKDLDNLLAGLQKSDLIILASRPSIGKSSLALNIADHIASEKKIPVGIFSLEMSKEQIIDRLLCLRGTVDSWKLRTGNLEDEDFGKLNYAMGVLSEAPIFIDDSPMLNAMEIRTKARRLQADNDLGLIVVDYLQLMQGATTRNSDNRVQEVSEISRNLKALARELDVPVLALSQLSRAVEHRPDKKPVLADLRESGCLAGDTLIMRADSGEITSIKSLVGQTDIPTLSLDKNWKLARANISKVFSSGRKMLYELKTRSGRVVKASANHPFLTIEGWRRLDEIKPSEKIALPRLLNTDNTPAEIGSFGQRGKKIKLFMQALEEIESNPNSDCIPQKVWQEMVLPAKTAVGSSWREVSTRINTVYCGTTLFKTGVSRPRMIRLAKALENKNLEALARSDIFWDEISSIKKLGIEEVFDATVEGTHNFIANDIIVHNSIEQDADVVMFIYRDDAYDTDSEKKNIAEILIRKHRNGPTGDIELYWKPEYMKFATIEKKLIEEK